MLVLLDTNTPLSSCADELGCPVEQLLTPLTRFRTQEPEAHFAIDNGAYSHFNRAAFLALLKREESRKRLCRFVAVPDVVGSARRTLEAFDYWRGEPCLHGWPLALVAQDGQEDLPIPWALIDAIFIGGTTDWKVSQHAVQIIRCAQVMNKWVHVGRVNMPGRFEWCESLGVHSIDGTGLSRFGWMRERIYAEVIAPQLFPRVEVSYACGAPVERSNDH